MSAKKISQQDMKMGRIHRCGNCEAKCDDTYKALGFTNSWGQRTKITDYYFCCQDCEKYFVREKQRPIFENNIAFYNETIPRMMEELKDSLKRGKIPCFFETIRYFKLMKRAKEMLLSQEHTYAEVAVAFLKARDVALALSEELQDEKNKKYGVIEYKYVIEDAKVCDDMMNGGIQAWF